MHASAVSRSQPQSTLNVTLELCFQNFDELQLWFRQGQLTTESSDSDLDKALGTYSQVESISSNFLMWIRILCGY